MSKLIKANIIVKNIIKKNGKSIKDLSLELNINETSLYNYLKGEKISNAVLSSLFNYIVVNGYDLFDLLDLEDDSYFYHMSSYGIDGIISAKYNLANKFSDFGYGFYLSESFKIASLYIKEEDNPHIYLFKRYRIKESYMYYFKDNIKGSEQWILFIGMNRQKIHNENYKTLINEKLIIKLKDKKCLVGKIADSLNFYIMDDFFNNNYDIFQVKAQLTKANLGFQYVIKDETLANSLKWDEEFIIDKSLKTLIIKWKEYKNKILKEDNLKSINIEDTKEDYRFNNIIRRIARGEDE